MRDAAMQRIQRWILIEYDNNRSVSWWYQSSVSIKGETIDSNNESFDNLIKFQIITHRFFFFYEIMLTLGERLETQKRVTTIEQSISAFGNSRSRLFWHSIVNWNAARCYCKWYLVIRRQNSHSVLINFISILIFQVWLDPNKKLYKQTIRKGCHNSQFQFRVKVCHTVRPNQFLHTSYKIKFLFSVLCLRSNSTRRRTNAISIFFTN